MASKEAKKKLAEIVTLESVKDGTVKVEDLAKVFMLRYLKKGVTTIPSDVDLKGLEKEDVVLQTQTLLRKLEGEEDVDKLAREYSEVYTTIADKIYKI